MSHEDTVRKYRYGHENMTEEEFRILWQKQGAPESFDLLIYEWSTRVEMLARKYGFRGEDIEDAKSMIFSQFYEGKYLDIYDPRIAVFSTFMYNFIKKRLMQLVSRKQRDPISNYIPLISTSDDEGSGEMFADMYDDGTRSMEASYESSSIIQEIRIRLAEQPQRGKRNLVALFDMLILDWPRSEMAKELDVSEATVCLMIKDLRDNSAIKMLRWK